MMKRISFRHFLRTLAIAAALATVGCGPQNGGEQQNNDLVFFGRPAAGSDAQRGSRIFGLDPDTGARVANCRPGEGCSALFEGPTDDGSVQIHSNGRVCADCHRVDANFQLAEKLPADQHIAADDPLLTFIDADSQFNPDARKNLNDSGLILIRPYRFKGLPKDDPFRKFVVWRKVPTNVNLAFARGFLHDLRNSSIVATDQAATQSHTQLDDLPFNNVADQGRLDDLAAFQFSLFSDARLKALLYPSDRTFSPSYQELVDDPYLTVAASTPAQLRGKEVFNRFCFTCHDVPNVFNNVAHRDPSDPVPAGQAFDIGIGQANFLNLDFSFFNTETGQKELVTLPLTKQTGEVVNVPVTNDIGLAGITKRWEDLYLFKVPQLRNLRRFRFFMHDNSIRSIEALVSYFNSDRFNQSRGGRTFPIHMTAEDEADLVEFLKIL